MRTIPTAQGTAWALGDAAHWIKVEVNDGSTWKNLNDLEGFDWVVGVDYGESIGARIADATVQVHTHQHDLSMSPLMVNSKINADAVLLQLNNDIRIYAAIMPLDTEPASSDWQQVFLGSIDRVAIGDTTIEIRARDQGGDLADAFVEDEQTYAPGGGVAVETVMQNILNDWGGSVTLVTPVSPSWLIAEYTQRREPVFDALRILADMIGFELRYKWDTSGTPGFKLVFFNPDRTKSTPDRTFLASEYVTLGRVDLDRAGIRNVVLVSYRDKAGRWQTVEVSDSSSITKYGRLWMEYAEERVTQVDSLSEATSLATAILSDQKEPTAVIQAKISYFPWVELGDLYRWTANGVQFDSDQDLSVKTIRHRLSATEAVTTLTCEGQPYSKPGNKWLANQANYSKKEVAVRNQDKNRIEGILNLNPDFSQWSGK